MRTRRGLVTGARMLGAALATVTLAGACQGSGDDQGQAPATAPAEPTTAPAEPTTAPAPPATAPAQPTTAPRRAGGPGETLGFVPFDSCDRFLAYVREEALARVGPYGLDPGVVMGGDMVPTAGAPATTAAAAGPARDEAAVNAAATPAAGGSSATNTQEAGVDEGDVVENDGQRAYSVVDGRLRVVDVAAGAGVAAATLPEGEHQLLLEGPRLVVTTQQWRSSPETIVSVFDVRDPSAPNLLGRTHLEGQAVAVRAAGGMARIVVSSPFGARLPLVYPDRPDDTDQAEAENRAAVEAATAADWLPRAYTEAPDGATTEPTAALDCAAVGHPEEPSGLGLLWVASVPLAAGAADVTAVGSGGVVAAGGTAYASATTLYVATVRQPEPAGTGGTRPIHPEPPVTAVHAFDLAAGGPAAYVASGTVPGTLLNQFSMSERDGRLRVAVTEQDAGFGDRSESSVHVLQRDAGGDRLVEIGAVGGLGRTEQIYAVRFVGDLAYVVTFRRTDPLYVIDLRDPTAPEVAGELRVPGYSAYLHPVSDTLLLGVGQSASDEGQRLGTKVTLFDVADPAAPVEAATLDVGGTSQAEFDHHAFLWWPAAPGAAQGELVIPVNGWRWDPPADGSGPQPPELAAVVADVGAGGIVERGRVTHQGRSDAGPFSEQVERSLVVAGQLVTVSDRGLLVTDLATLADVSWVPFS